MLILGLSLTQALWFVTLITKGGSKSKPRDKLSIELWYWCLKRNNIVPAEHVRGTHNLEADLKSRNFDIALCGVLMTQFFHEIIPTTFLLQ